MIFPKFDACVSVSRAQPPRPAHRAWCNRSLNLIHPAPGLQSDRIPIGAMSIGVDCNTGDRQTVANHGADVADSPSKQQHDIGDTIQIAV
jgi:hypothetical protein